MICPCCGSTSIETKEIKKVMENDIFSHAILLPTLVINITSNKCLQCSEIGDFENRNSEILEKAKIYIREKSMSNFFIRLDNECIKLTYVARKLGLPMNILQTIRDKNDYSDTAYSIIRMVFMLENIWGVKREI